jgi:nitrite reductase/ring-hydroxylating ferredoxin subunit
VCVVFCFACRKNNNNELVPYYVVNFSFSLSDPQYNKLNAPGAWLYVTGGSRGIIIYRKSNDEFMAYDRHCTYKVEDLCRVNVNSSQVVAVDSCCGSQFVLTDGSIIKGPASRTLITYRTFFDGNRLQVYN